MKKAKRILAVILAAIMIASASCLPVYARLGGKGGPDDYTIYTENGVEKYYFTPDQGATYVLDLIDNLLADSALIVDLDDIGLGSNFLKGLLNLNKLTYNGLYLDSIDHAIISLREFLKAIDEGFVATIATDLINAIGDLNDLKSTWNYIDASKLRGTAPLYQGGSKDLDVLYNVLNWLSHCTPVLGKVASGNVNVGLLDDFLDEDITNILCHLPTWLKGLLYGLLVNENVETMPAGETIDSSLQKVVDWALITGTGEAAENGGLSILGANFEPILPAIANQPGQANIGSIAIQADQNGDGVPEAHTMSFYQLVNNAIQALLGGTLKDLLSGVLFDALDIDPEENGGLGDPEIMSDTVFNLIVGAVEGLCVQNGAPPVVYSEDAMSYPVPKINALLDWFFMPGGGLETLISFSYQGIHLQDNLMSLLNDLARLAPGLLGALGLEVDESLLYSSDELAATWSYNSNLELCTADDDDAQGIAYVSYEKDANGNPYDLYVSETVMQGDTEVPSAYCYLGTGAPVNIVDASQADYINPTFIRQKFVIDTPKVWAVLLKVLLNNFIDGCYFPEWADSISSVGAYALASLAAPILPEENFFERLDRYHYEVELKQPYIWKVADAAYHFDPLPYTEEKKNPANAAQTVTVPKAALEIGSAIGAFYLNGVFDFEGAPLASHYSSLEQFAFEFLMWGFTHYLPILAGERNNSTGEFSGGTFSSEVNIMLNAVYSDKVNRTYKSNPNFDAIYRLLDNTLFALLPASWLPDEFHGSFNFLNKWLLNSVVKFDLQQLFSLFSTNTTGELNKSVTQVLLNIVARVLSIVFNGAQILPAASGLSGMNLILSDTPTTVTSLDGLLSGSNLQALLTNLLTQLYNNRVGLCETIFPLILSLDFIAPYDTQYLGSDLARYKVQDLEDYLNYFQTDANAEIASGVVNFDKENQAAEAAALIGAEVVRATENNKTVYKVTFPASYDSAITAQAASKYFDDAYVASKEINGETKYVIYSKLSYLDSATRSGDLTDAAGTYHTYSGFSYAKLTGRTASDPFVEYDDDYRFLDAEDFKGGVYYYNNYENAIEDASDFLGDYKSMATSTLPGAYQDWFKFMIKARLYAAGLYDSNDDGAFSADSDSTPSIPDSMYPYYTTASVNWNYYDSTHQGIIGRGTTANMNEFNANNYEVYALAVEYGNNPENNVTLSIYDAESVVRLALGNMLFDITKKADGTYNAGTYQWTALSDAQKSTITTFCSNNGMVFNYDGDNSTISMKAFAPITDSMTFGVTSAMRPTFTTADGSFAEKIATQVCTSYDEYVEEMRNMRVNLYNYIDSISYRAESADANRSNAVNTVVLNWALEYTKPAYIDTVSKLRNQQITGAVNGELTYGKIYTTSSYAKFQEAYDFAKSLFDAANGNASASGLTQSLVSAAYEGLIDAYRLLVLFTGEASWDQLVSYIEMANGLTNNADPNGNPEGDAGYVDETYDKLVEELLLAIDMYENSGYDCEYQDEINAEANDLYMKIAGLIFRISPNLEPAIDSVIKIKQTNEADATNKRGHIFNLVEGIGITEELYSTVGMLNIQGNSCDLIPNQKGNRNGTGAYVLCTMKEVPRFLYYAVIFGDVNGDTRIDGTDKSTVEYYNELYRGNSTAMESAMGGAQFEAADVNHDGNVDSTDAELIESYYNYNYVIDQASHNADVVA